MTVGGKCVTVGAAGGWFRVYVLCSLVSLHVTALLVCGGGGVGGAFSFELSAVPQ